MTENGYSLSDIAAAAGGNNDGMFGGNNGGWWLILLFLIFGGRGFGYGGGNGGGGANAVYATPADVTTAVDRQTFIGKLDGITNSISAGFASAAMDNAKCCCEIQAAIQNGFCTTNNSINNATRDIIENANANGRAILDFLTQNKIDTLRDENQALKFQVSQTAQNALFNASQDAQTAELIRRLRAPDPVPSYIVPNPNCCYQYGFQPVNACGCGGNAF
jgi:hypothetical protein